MADEIKDPNPFDELALLRGRLARTIGDLLAGLLHITRGGLAPTRKRPRRVHRKIDKRGGYLHYTIAPFRRRPS